MLIESIGIIAAVLTTAAYFPQVIKTWKIGNFSIVLTNGLTALFSCVVLYFNQGSAEQIVNYNKPTNFPPPITFYAINSPRSSMSSKK